MFECDIAHCRSVAVLCMLYKIKYNPMHSLKGIIYSIKKFFIIHFRENCSKQNMNTFRENVFVCEDFLSTVKERSCIENIRIWRGPTENLSPLPILEIGQN